MKIGIITMHKVLNYGSALQAYALQQKLLSLGYENELIDYQYPRPVAKKKTIKSFFSSVVIFIRNAIIGFPLEKKKRKFDLFYNQNFKLSKEYYTYESLQSNPPQYDVYITGSDQVWNPRFAGNDSNFFLSFAPDDKPKLSYAASFATSVIEDDKKGFYSKYLSRYDSISVRENTGVKLVKELTGKDAVLCCDPTILLTSEEWDKLAIQSQLEIKYKYILVYVLNYMIGDIYPEIQRTIDYVQKTLGYKVIYLVGRKEDAFRKNSFLYKKGGPAEFIYLFKHAEFVITTSFHGVAFSLIYDKPLLGVVNMDKVDDTRIQSLLSVSGAENSVMDFRDKINMSATELLNLKGDKARFNTLREASECYLRKSVACAC